jgi:hypothetical protein
MSIIRENQLRQIREEDNNYKKRVLDMMKQQIKDYQENIMSVPIIDDKEVDLNLSKTDIFTKYLNDLYIKIRQPDIVLKIFPESGELQKYINLLDIYKPFEEWNNLISSYNDTNLNIYTREQIKNGFQKMVVYLNKICDFFNDIIEQLMQFVLESKGVITETELNQYFTTKYKGLDLIAPNVKKTLFKTKSIGYLLKIHIESLAFFNNIKNDINNNKFQPLSKQSIAYEITKILENIYVKNKDANIKKYLMDLFKETEIPTLSPFFKKGYEDFENRFNELDSMGGYSGLSKVYPSSSPFSSPFTPPAPPAPTAPTAPTTPPPAPPTAPTPPTAPPASTPPPSPPAPPASSAPFIPPASTSSSPQDLMKEYRDYLKILNNPTSTEEEKAMANNNITFVGEELLTYHQILYNDKTKKFEYTEPKYAFMVNYRKKERELLDPGLTKNKQNKIKAEMKEIIDELKKENVIFKDGKFYNKKDNKEFVGKGKKKGGLRLHAYNDERFERLNRVMNGKGKKYTAPALGFDDRKNEMYYDCINSDYDSDYETD